MRKRMFLFAVLFMSTVSLLTMLGCGGGGGSSSPEEIDSGESSQYSAYVFGPALSGKSLFKLYNLADTTMEDGVLVLDSPGQAPSGFVPLVGCKVTLPDGTVAVTDGTGRFQFSRMPFSRSERGIPLLVDPEASDNPRFGKVIIPLIVPRRGVEIPQDTEGLRLVVKPGSLLLSQGSRFLYHAFLVDDSTGALYRAEKVTWSVDSERGVGTILSDGLFRSANLGKGHVVAIATINSAEMTASSDVEVVDNQQVARIYGQVTDVNQYPIAGIIIFVSGFENGAVTNGQGNYLAPRVPTGESLTLTLLYRGIVVKTLNDVVVADGEAKEINVTLDTFRETGKLSYRIGQGQTEGRVVMAVEGLPGLLSTDEFPAMKEFELLKVNEVNHDLYTRLQENPNMSFPVIVEGKPFFSSADDSSSLPQVEVTYLQVLLEQLSAPVQTLQGEVSWQAGEGQEGQIAFRVVARNPNATPNQFVLSGIENFPRVLAKLQGASGTWFSAKLIGQVNRTSWSITLLEISLIDTFFQGEGKVYYDPEFASNRAILLEISSGSNTEAGGQNAQTRHYLLLNIESVSPDVYNLLISSAGREFPGSVSGVEIDDPVWAEYDCQPLKVSQIQIYSGTDDYLLHRQGKIWRNDEGQIQFSPSLSLNENGESTFILQGIEPFDEILTPLRQSPGTAYSCYLSGNIQGTGGSEISVSQLDILGKADDQEETGRGLRPDGFTYYVTDNSTPLGGKYLYQKFLPDGSIDETKLYELTNITRGTYSDIADLLKANPGLILQITLNYTDTTSLGSGQNPFGTTIRLLVNSMSVLEDADPLFKISGNLIYHSWENILEMVATSSAFPGGIQQSFIMQSVPDNILSQLLSHPDRFVPVSGIIQVFQTERRSNREPLKAKALDLTILTYLN